MKSEEYKKFLKKIKRDNFLVFITQILIIIFFFIIWQILADKELVNTFLVSAR